MENATARLKPNTTQIPNYILDEVMPLLTDTEFKVLMVIARQTYGWHKKSDRISYTQLQQKTNSSRSSIAKALKSLKEKNLIIAESDGQDIYYSINTGTEIKPASLEIELPSSKNELSSSTNNELATSSKNEHTKETNTKETNTKEKERDKEKESSLTKVSSSPPQKYSSLDDLTEQDFKEIAQHYQVPMAFVMSKYEDLDLWASQPRNAKKIQGRNWRKTLMAWVKKDALEIMTRQRKGGVVDATNL